MEKMICKSLYPIKILDVIVKMGVPYIQHGCWDQNFLTGGKTTSYSSYMTLWDQIVML